MQRPHPLYVARRRTVRERDGELQCGCAARAPIVIVLLFWGGRQSICSSVLRGRLLARSGSLRGRFSCIWVDNHTEDWN